MTSVRVFLVEDDARLRAELAASLAARSDLQVLAQFGTAEAALASLRGGLDADVGLVDLRLPGMSGRELIVHARSLRPGLDLVVLTAFDDDQTLYDALRAGATGYLLKDSGPDEIAAALFEVRRGGAPMSPGIARRVLAGFRVEPSEGDELSPREREVLDLLSRGATYPLIGEALEISTSTVQTHIRSIYRKLEVSTKAEATLEALRRGYLR